MAKKESTKSITEKTSLVNLNNPRALANFANDLKDFVVKNRLYTEIVSKKKDDKGNYVELIKNYVNVEGWQFAGASMGIFPLVVNEENIPTEGEVKTKYSTNPVYKYKATVELLQLSTGKIVGRGVALCSNQESKKQTFDEFAVLSMAQTRATAKAYRLTLGWIMKLAGYEATPTEEIDDIEGEVAGSNDSLQPSLMPIADVKYLVDMKLGLMSVTDKLKFLKDNIRTISDKEITDDQYRLLYEELSKSRGDKADV